MTNDPIASYIATCTCPDIDGNMRTANAPDCPRHGDLADPFANIPNASDEEYAGTELETTAERTRREARESGVYRSADGNVTAVPVGSDFSYVTTSYCPSCGQTVKWSTVYSPAHWVHLTNLATIQCPDIAALDYLPGPQGQIVGLS